MKSGETPGGRFAFGPQVATRPGEVLYRGVEAGSLRRPLAIRVIRGEAPFPLREDLLDLSQVRFAGFLGPGRVCSAPEGLLFARPWVAGKNLREFLDGRAVREALPCFIDAAIALGTLHRLGHLHRNLKPGNVLVPAEAGGRRTGRPRAVLVDPAWWSEDSVRRDADPEPARVADPSVASDLYDLGAAFYACLTGHAPQCGAEGFPPAPRGMNPDVPKDLDRLLLKLLSPRPEHRHADAFQVAEDLVAIAGGKRAVPSFEQVVPECFVGREQAWEIPEPLVARAGEGAGILRALAIGGESGTGKTALADRIRAAAEIAGFRLARAACTAPTGEDLEPIFELIEALVPPGAEGRTLRRQRSDLRGSRVGSHASAEPSGLFNALLALASRASGNEPLLLILEDLHRADPMTVEFALFVVRRLEEWGAGEPDIRIAVTFRTEEPYRGPLAKLTEAFGRRRAERASIELGPLTRAEVGSWLAKVLPERIARSHLEAIHASTGGRPYLVREALRALHGGRERSDGGGEGVPTISRPALPADLSSILRRRFLGLPEPERRILRGLAVLGRRSGASMLEAASGRPPREIEDAVRRLQREGFLDGEGIEEPVFFRYDAFRAWAEKDSRLSDTREIHLRIARHLLAHERSGPRASPVGVAHHLLEGGDRRLAIRYGLEAARRLRERHDPKRALEFYRRTLAQIPERDSARREDILREMADLHAVLGEPGKGIELLRPLIDSGDESRDAIRSGSLHRSLGVLYHRAGDAGRGVLQLERSLDLLQGARGRDALREVLAAEAELAEIHTFRGEYERAEAICRRGLARLPGARIRTDPDIRHAEMVLLETLGHLSLRRFDYPEAERHFRESLRIAQSIEAPERPLILNNLGILFIQSNRFRDAIRCYRQARRLAISTGADGARLSIEANLATLHAKTGEPDEADAALRSARRLSARSDSARARLLALHAGGFVDHVAGRTASAIDSLSQAVALGEEIGDRHVAAYDLIYLGEAALERGDLDRARDSFERAIELAGEGIEPFQGSASSRLALVHAIRGDAGRAEEAWRRALTPEASRIAYPAAWNRIFCAEAMRRCGRLDEAITLLQDPRRFFSRVRVPAGWIRSILELIDADLSQAAQARELDQAPRTDPHIRRASARLEELLRRHPPGEGAMRNPALAARALAARVELELAGADPDLGQVQEGLVRAEGFLIGRRLPEIERRLRRLRRSLRKRLLDAEGAEKPAIRRTHPLPAPVVSALRDKTREILRRAEASETFDEPERLAILTDGVRELASEIDDAMAAVGARGGSSAEAAAGGFGGGDTIIAASRAMQDVLAAIDRAKEAEAPVLIWGETGTGKELVARAIHRLGSRREKAFVAINCGAMPPDLLEAELFGYRRGSFTGADEDRTGLIASADGGTFLFDEIGEMPIDLQPKLLRVLESRSLRPVGASDELPFDVRFVFASNRDLAAEVRAGRFRRDLYYRIRVLEIRIPPLRQRPEDVAALLDHFARVAAEELGREPVLFDEGAVRTLERHAWPGNVREIRNFVYRLSLTDIARADESAVRALLRDHEETDLFPSGLLMGRPLAELQAELDREYIVALARRRRGDLRAVARELGLKRRGFYAKLQKLGIAAAALRGGKLG